ncbi:MAG: AraC family transcriptional regulator [Polaromonas sp.]
MKPSNHSLERGAGMSERSALVSRFGGHFESQDAPKLTTQTLTKGALAVSQVGCHSKLGVAKLMPPEDAFVVGLSTRACAALDYSVEGMPVVPTAVGVGDLMVHDMNRDPIWDLHSPFRTIIFYLPRKTLSEIAHNAGAPQIGGLDLQPGLTVFDPVMNQLSAALAPAFERPNEACGLFVDHVLVAASLHIAHVYGHMRMVSQPVRGGLAPWQERRAKEILTANLHGDIALIDLANECGLSVRHFARAFRQSTGTPPHRWLLEQRVDKAKDLLLNSSSPLADIALACGFADQSHFTRAFTRAASLSPGAWRRMR